MNFRSDINALRAWAVVLVILFHFSVPLFGGGFVGVDVFFVISGFLMTGILYRHFYDKSPTTRPPFYQFIYQFYLSRATRIIPALLFLCAVLLVVGWFFLPSIYYEQLGKHAVGAILFLSNWMFNKESGYFDTDSHEKLLLHTWSLSVEWQFYLILPLIVMLCWWILRSKINLVAVYVLATLISLAFAIYQTNADPTAAFYLLPSRAWQMLSGGLVYLLASNLKFTERRSNLLSALGYLCIIVSTLWFDASTPWPSYYAVLPVIGACLILTANSTDRIWSFGRVGQALGSSSYSLYLWHWPFSVILFYLGWSDWVLAICAGLLLSFVMGWLSYRLIETPSRKWLSKLALVKSSVLIVLVVTLVVAAGAWVKLQGGVHGRVSPQLDLIFDEKNNTNDRESICGVPKGEPTLDCLYGGPELGAIVLGDSHAQSVVRSVEKSMSNPDLHVLDWTLNGCASIFGLKNSRGGVVLNAVVFCLRLLKLRKISQPTYL